MQNELTAKRVSGFWTFIGCVLVTLGVGTLSGWLSGAMKGYEGINVPAFTPPDWVFSVVWPILYAMIGVALYLIITYSPMSSTEQRIKVAATILWAIQLALNLLWPFVFFNIDYTVAFIINALLVSVVTSLVTLGFFIRPLSSAFLLPYWGWILFATYETLMIIVLNA